MRRGFFVKCRPSKARRKAFDDCERLVEWVAGRTGGRRVRIPRTTSWSISRAWYIHELQKTCGVCSPPALLDLWFFFFSFRSVHCPQKSHPSKSNFAKFMLAPLDDRTLNFYLYLHLVYSGSSRDLMQPSTLVQRRILETHSRFLIN